MDTDRNPRLSRRAFNLGCAAFGLSLRGLGAGAALGLGARARAAIDNAPPPAPAGTPRTVRFPDGTRVPAVGQGSWHIGQGRHPPQVEAEALRTGVALGMTLIDTSGNYGGGRSEELLSGVLEGERGKIFLVTKVETRDIAGDGIARACEASLGRLKTDLIDLYLLHWPVPDSDFAGVVAAFERLRAAGKISAWGVSNFSREQMDTLMRVPDGKRCATNQVPYSLNNRRIERDVLPWCREHGMPVMAYSPLGGDHALVTGDRTLAAIGAAHGVSASAVALAWVIRNGNVIAIPEAGSPEHVRENAAALALMLTPQELAKLDAAFPAP